MSLTFKNLISWIRKSPWYKMTETNKMILSMCVISRAHISICKTNEVSMFVDVWREKKRVEVFSTHLAISHSAALFDSHSASNRTKTYSTHYHRCRSLVYLCCCEWLFIHYNSGSKCIYMNRTVRITNDGKENDASVVYSLKQTLTCQMKSS